MIISCSILAIGVGLTVVSMLRWISVRIVIIVTVIIVIIVFVIIMLPVVISIWISRIVTWSESTLIISGPASTIGFIAIIIAVTASVLMSIIRPVLNRWNAN